MSSPVIPMMTAPILRPMTLGEILDRSIQMLRQKLALFAGIALLPEVVGLAHSLATLYRKELVPTMGAGQAALTALIQFALQVLSLAAGALELAALCWAAARVLQGENASVRAAYASLRGRAWRMFGVGTLEGLASMWPVLPLAIVIPFMVMPLELPSIWSIGIIVVLALVPCTALYPRYVLGFPVAVIEGKTAGDSIRRSVALGRGYRWKVLGAIVLPVCIALVLFGSTTVIFEWLNARSRHFGMNPMFWSTVDQVFTAMARLVVTPLNAIVLTVMYFDLRVRKEGLDIERMMEAAGMPADAPLPGLGEPPQAASSTGDLA